MIPHKTDPAALTTQKQELTCKNAGCEKSFIVIEQEAQFYKDKNTVTDHLDKDKIQCLVGRGYVPFGRAQQPKLTDFPDGVDLLEFLKSLT